MKELPVGDLSPVEHAASKPQQAAMVIPKFFDFSAKDTALLFVR
jgi:hypothetical protein